MRTTRQCCGAVHLKLKFKTFGGSAIDLGAFQATYIKEPAVDLTARLKPFAQQTGIDIPDAQLPPGEHFIQLGIKDSDGRAVTKIFKLKVAPSRDQFGSASRFLK